MLMAMRVVMGLCLFTGCYLLVHQLRQTRLISRTVQKVYKQLSESSRVRQKEQQRIKERTGPVKGLAKMDQRLQYSGIRTQFPFLTTELSLLLLVLSAGLGYYVMYFLSDSLVLRIAALGCGPVLLLFYVSIRCHQNYHRTEGELLIMLNLLDSYSISASELTGIFYRIAPYVEEPVKTSLEETYFEAQTTGDVTLALQHLIDKVEHPQFKQFIKNLEVSNRYDADFSNVVKNSRKSVQDYLAYRKKRKSISNVAKIEMLLLAATAMLTFSLMGTILEQSIWELLFHTPPGKGILLFFMAVLLLFYWQVVLFDKE